MLYSRACWVLNTLLLLLLLCLFFKHSDGKATSYVPTPRDPATEDRYYEYFRFCEFTSRRCAWNATSNVKWHDGQSTSLGLEGPLNDRDFSSNVVLFFRTPNDHSETTESFESPIFKKLKKGVECFKFRFVSMIGGKVQDGLHLYLVDPTDESRTEIWSRASIDIDRWISEQVNVVTNSSYKLLFEGKGDGGFAAVQDFTSEEGFCKNRECDFESGNCPGWTLKGFKRIQASKSMFNYSRDHTTGSSFGRFAYINLEENQDNQPMIIEGPEMKNLETQCFSFSFMRSAPDVNFNLFRKSLKDDKYDSIWASNISHISDEWITVRPTLHIRDPIKLVLQVPSELVSTSALAVDDISLLPGECPAPVSCSFEENFCGWHHNMKYPRHWSIGKGRVVYPKHLKTEKLLLDSRSLLYTDFTNIDKTIIETVEITSETIEVGESTKRGMCLRIDIIVVSDLDDDGDFSVQQETLSLDRKQIFSFKASKLGFNKWFKQKQIYVPFTEKPYRLVLSAQTRSVQTRIGVANLDLSSDLAKCDLIEGIPTAGPTSSPTPSPNPFAKLVCDFEVKTKANCGWVPSSKETGNFEIMTAFSSKVPGKYIPHADHTEKKETGGFIAAYNIKAKGKLAHPTLTGKWPDKAASYPICVDFAYYYYINDAGNAAMLTVENDKDSKTIWRAPPGISNQWHRVRFSFEPKDKKYASLTFRADLVEGVLALDDIAITSGLCEEKLGNHYDYNQDYICDFEDETTCLFNAQFVSDNIVWNLYKAGDIIKNLDYPGQDPHEPPKKDSMVDHSTRTKNGHFYGVYFKDLATKDTSRNIITQSKVLDVEDQSIKCIKFSYYLEDIVQNDTIFGYVVRENIESDAPLQEAIREWKISGSTNGLWFTHRVPVTWLEDAAFTFVIEVKNMQKVIEMESKVFIDDFVLSTESCEMKACYFDQNTCFLEPIPIDDNHLSKAIIVQIGKEDTPNSHFQMPYLTGYVDTYFRMFSPHQNKDLDLDRATRFGSAGNILLLTTDDDWQRAVMVTDRFVIDESFGSRQVCLSFQLTLPDKAAYIQVVTADSNTRQSTLLWGSHQSTGGKWKLIEIYAEPVNNQVLDMYFYIIGTIGDKEMFIALDDVIVKTYCDGTPANEFPTTRTQPPPFTGTTVSPTKSWLPDPTMFRCKNGHKIELEKLCDGRWDCRDGSDEIDCGSCTFEDHHKCGYQTIPQNFASTHGDFEWKLSNNDAEKLKGHIFDEDDFWKEPYLIVSNVRGFDFEKNDNEPLIAVVQSRIIHSTYADCELDFEYRANGTNHRQNYFEVFINNVDTEQTSIILQSYSRPPVQKNNRWEKIEISIGRMSNRFQLGFRAVIADNSFESHSIKKIDMKSCSPKNFGEQLQNCEHDDGQFFCKNMICIKNEKKCDLTDDCGDNSDEADGCDFDHQTTFSNGFGLWTPYPETNETIDGFDVRSSNAIRDMLVGPLYDHTRGPTGYIGSFALYRPTKGIEDKKEITARLISPYFRFRESIFEQSSCSLRVFSYTNTYENVFQVHLLDIATQKMRNMEDSRWTMISGRWVRHLREFSSLDKASDKVYRVFLTVTLSLESVNDTGIVPYVALDDISFTSQCELLTADQVEALTTVQPIDPNTCPTFKCKNTNGTESCLREDQLCDLTKDCADGLDEKNCGNCDFDESNFCGWTFEHDDAVWRLQLPAKEAKDLNGVPKKDGEDKPKGGYIYEWNPGRSYNALELDYATLYSPMINYAVYEQCEFQFKHRSMGKSAVRVKMTSKDRPERLLAVDSDGENSWKTYSAQIGAHEKGFQIIISSYAVSREESIVKTFLDSFKLVNCDPNKIVDKGRLTCDFELVRGFCGWTMVENDTSSTKIDHWMSISRSPEVEPGHDHTSLKQPKPNEFGTWIGVHDKEYAVAYLGAIEPLKRNQQYCFSFWYYLMSYQSHHMIALYSMPSRTSQLPVLNDSMDGSKLLELRNVNQRNWLQAWVNFKPSDKPRYLLFFVEVSETTFIGLDDFLLTDTNCSEFALGGSCNFENGQCSWKTPNGGWKLDSKAAKSHTTDDFQGHYMKQVADVDNEAIMSLALADAPEIADLQSKNAMCINIYYSLKTEQYMTDEYDTYVGIRVLDDDHSVVRSVNITATQVAMEDREGVWSMMALNFVAKETTVIEIFGQRQKKQSVVLVDDVTIYDRPCQVNGNCDFETDLCGWTNELNHKSAIFVRFQPLNELDSQKFIKFDHTKQNEYGHYLIYTTFNGDTEPQKLLSPMIRSPSSTVCLSFWYFAQTANFPNYPEPALKLVFKSLTFQNGQTIEICLNSTEFEWTEWKQTLKGMPKFFSLYFSFVPNVHFQSDIGFDDILIDIGHCDSEPTPTEVAPESERQLDCSLETGSVCRWKFGENWRLGNFAQQNDTLAPPRDHTSGKATGRYAMVIKSNANAQVSNIDSDFAMHFDTNRCLSLWYWEDNEYDFELRIKRLESDGQETNITVFQSQIENRKKWNFLKITIPLPVGKKANETYQLRIEYCWNCGSTKADDAEQTRLAIDDLQVRPGRCGHQTDYVYNFEDGWEDLVLENIQPIKSTVLNRVTPSFATSNVYPAFDHTTRTEAGNYALFQPNNKQLFFRNTITLMDLKKEDPAVGAKCVRFAYQLSENVTFKAFILAENEFDYDYDRSTDALQWRAKNPTPRNMWTIAEFSKNINFDHKLVLYMASEANENHFIAIDDLVIRNHKCQLPVDCDFENSNYCSYTTMPFEDDPLFSFGLVTTPVNDPSWAGPRDDHTNGGEFGGYLILSTAGHKRSKSPHHTQMVSGPRDVSIESNYCLQMYTVITTRDLKLKLSLIRLGGDFTDKNRKLLLTTLENIEQTKWTSLSVNLNETVLETATQFQLVIEGVLTEGSKGVIAIDDISLQNTICEQSDDNNPTGSDLICEDGTVLNSSQICDFNNDCPSGLDEASCGTCDFESSTTCGWKNLFSVSGKFAMTPAKDASGLAPKKDGSNSVDGHYLLLKPSAGEAISKAEIAVNYEQSTMMLKRASETCLMIFDAYMHTSSKNARIEVKVSANIDEAATVYVFGGKNDKDQWQNFTVNIGHRWSSFIVDISASADRDDILAIDNVRFTDCALPKPKPFCDDDTEFRCQKYGFCISKDAYCDDVDDCGDNSDEDTEKCKAMAMRCNFELSLEFCSIKDESKIDSVAYWRKSSIRNPSKDQIASGYEPRLDNTHRTQIGNYYLLSTGYGTQAVYTGSFSSVMIKSRPEGKCRVRFFFYIHDAPEDVEKSKLEIHKRYSDKTTIEDGDMKELTITVKELQQRWIKKAMQLPDTSPFQLIFTGILGTNQARIAIDDITFDQGCLISSVSPATTSTPHPEVVNPVTDKHSVSTLGTDAPTGTTSGSLDNAPKASNGHGVAIAVGIAVPAAIVLIVAGVLVWMRSRKTGRDDKVAFSLNRLSRK